MFLDGVGLAPPGPDNAFSTVPMPHLCSLLGGPLVLDGAAGRPEIRPDVALCTLDACLGVPGLPQSATGQTALFTGLNAAAMVGDHVSAHPTAPLREVIAEHSFMKRAAECGAGVLFANAHSARFWQMVEARKLRLGASTLAAMAANAAIPTLDDLLAGKAVLWDITHEVATRFQGHELPVISAEEAGARLARLSAEYDLVFYESFLTDLAGHRRIEAEWVLSRLDTFLGAVLAGLPPETTLVISSDHGNIEDSTTKAHTTNPVPLLAVGPAAERFRSITAITGVAPAIVSVLECEHERRPAH